MSNFRFELNINGLRELMKSGEMQDALQEAGNAVAGQGSSMSGEPYGTKVVTASYVSICQVFPQSAKGHQDTINNLTALKALGASGIPMKK